MQCVGVGWESVNGEVMWLCWSKGGGNVAGTYVL